MSIDDLERKLYGQRPEKKQKQVQPQGPVPSSKPEIPRAWTETEQSGGGVLFEKNPEARNGNKMSFFKKALFVGIGIFGITVLIAVGFLLIGPNGSPEKVNITVSVPTDTSRGVPFDLIVDISNGSETPIQDAIIEVGLPLGVISIGNTNGGSDTLVTQSVGDVGGGASLENKKFALLPIGEVSSIQKVTVKLSYAAGGKSRFEVEETKEIKIKDTGISIEFVKPDQVLRSSSFSFEVKYKNLTDFDYPQIAIEAKYPGAFKFESASLSPDSLNNYWKLGELRHGSIGSLEIKGRLEGVEESRFEIPIVVYANYLGHDYPILEESVAIALAPSPIRMEVVLNGRTDYVARIGDEFTYSIRYQNLSGIALADVVLKATLMGEVIDFGSLQTEGNLNSLSNSITWNASNVPSLRLLDPNATGEVTVKGKLKNLFPIKRLNDKNYILRMSAQMDSPSVPYYVKADKTSAAASLETKVAGFVVMDAQAFFRDLSSGLANLGAMPPRANQSTEYTIHWILRNYSTDIKNISIRANLQSGVEWTGVVKSNTDTVPIWSERTGEVVWSIEKVFATKGVINAPVEAIFQVRATPNLTQVGQFQPLLSTTNLTAVDDFTGLDLIAQDTQLTTALPDDKTIGQDGGKVLP